MVGDFKSPAAPVRPRPLRRIVLAFCVALVAAIAIGLISGRTAEADPPAADPSACSICCRTRVAEGGPARGECMRTCLAQSEGLCTPLPPVTFRLLAIVNS